MKNKIIILIFLLLVSAVQAQTKTSLEQFYSLIGKGVQKVDSTTRVSKSITLDVTTSPMLELLKAKVWEKFTANGFNCTTEELKDNNKVLFTLFGGSVDYQNTRKNSFFGEMICDRKVTMQGSVQVRLPNGAVHSITLDESIVDTIAVEEIKKIEDPSLPFTQGQFPQIPFFSNLLEPAIVIGTVIATVILLFTVRSK